MDMILCLSEVYTFVFFFLPVAYTVGIVLCVTVCGGSIFMNKVIGIIS